MCLAVPGQVVEFLPDNDQLARIEISGVRRVVNVGLLADEDLVVGEWVLIHVGFAMAKIDEAEAADALAALKVMGPDFDAELALLKETES